VHLVGFIIRLYHHDARKNVKDVLRVWLIKPMQNVLGKAPSNRPSNRWYFSIHLNHFNLKMETVCSTETAKQLTTAQCKNSKQILPITSASTRTSSVWWWRQYAIACCRNI